MPKSKLVWPFIPFDELDNYAAQLVELRKAASTVKTWDPVYTIWSKWCKLYNINPHDHELLANETTIKRFLAYRMKIHDIGSSWARGNSYVLRDWWMQHNVICRVDSKAMPLLHHMYQGRNTEKPPGILFFYRISDT